MDAKFKMATKTKFTYVRHIEYRRHLEFLRQQKKIDKKDGL
jgi:hypothetical protein